MNRWAQWGAISAAAYGALVLLAQRSLYFPSKYPEGFWDWQAELGAEDALPVAADGVKLHGWWVAAPEQKLATLFLHGNAGNVTHRALAIQGIRKAGSSVLMLDYRGFGRSEGRPSERGMYADADAGFDFLVNKGYAPGNIVIHGESLGTAVAVELAARRPCAGVVLEAPFPSVSDVAGSILPVVGRTVVWGFHSASRIGKVRVPLLIIHGSRDELVDISLGRRLFEMANEPKAMWVVEGAGHNDLPLTAGTDYRDRLHTFYELVLNR